MADMRRRTPEPPAGIPHIQQQPGLADELLRDLAPLLAKEGIDLDSTDLPDRATFRDATPGAGRRPPPTASSRPPRLT